MANFEMFCLVISSSINLSFLKSDVLYNILYIEMDIHVLKVHFLDSSILVHRLCNHYCALPLFVTEELESFARVYNDVTE